MVGVAGRSKACYDCKRRRVKCDLTRPLCQRCSKAGIHCQGYQRDTLWVNRTPDQPGVTALSVISDAQAQKRIQEGPRPSKGRLHQLDQLRSSLRDHLRSGTSQQGAISFRQQAWPLLEDIYLPREQYGTTAYEREDMDNNPSPSSWLKDICHMQGPSDALDHALLAFCALQISLSGESGISHDDAVQFYNDALGKMIKELDPQGGRREDEVIGAVIMLSTAEIFLFSDDTSFTVHARAIPELLRDRSFVPNEGTSSSRSLLRRLSVVCIVQAMSRKQPASVEPQRWRQLLGPKERPGSFSELLDIAMTIPSMMQKVYALLQHSDKESIDTSRYRDDLVWKYHELEHWRETYQQLQTHRTKAPLYWAVPSRAHNPADDRFLDQLFPFSLTFASVHSAIPWLMGLTFMLGVLDCIQVLESISSNNSREPVGSSADGGQGPFTVANADRMARNMCQAVEFCYRKENGTFGPQSTCSSQCVLVRYFERRGLARELEWCRAIKDMEGPGSSFGIDMMKMGLES